VISYRQKKDQGGNEEMTRSAKEIYRDVVESLAAEERTKMEALAPKIEALKSEELPALEGSEKQIAWATDIRLRKLAELEQMMEEALAEMPGEKELIEAQGQEYKAKLLKITRAATWIDARGYKVEDIITSVCRRLGV
jgi:hypothetical protein